MVHKVGRLAWVLPDPSRTGEPEVDGISPAPEAVLPRAAPMGLNPSGDWWCRKSDEAIAGLPRVLKLVDNILVHAPLLVELRGRMRSVLQRCHARPWHHPQQEV